MLPPALLKLFSKKPALKAIHTGSEKMSSYFEGLEIHNFYGMSEPLVPLSSFKVDKKYDNAPIGKGFKDVEILVFDENNKECKDGQIGQLVIKGDFSQKYFKDPGKSAKTFVKDGDKTLVFTSDLGFKDKNGNVTISGRKDWMIKIHGQRVEIYEIESALNGIKGMRECAVKAFCDKHGQNYLVAFVVCDSSAELLRDELTKSLVEYMIPRYFVFMDVLPKNVNGKIDRKSLNEPKIDEVASKKDFIEPKTKEERELCAVFESVLGCKNVGLNDDFNALGGDSLAAASIAAASKLKGISPSLIIKEKTPQNIIKACAELKSLDHDQTSAELTSLQKYMCSIDKAAGTTSFRVPFYLKLPQNVDIERFKKALNAAFLTHKIFNARVEKSSLVYREENLVLDFQKTDNLESFFSSYLKPSFDLEHDRLYRFCICEYKGWYYLVCDVHHIIIDGNSIGIFARDIAHFYNNPETKLEPELLAFSKNYAKLVKDRRQTEFAHKVANIDSSPKGDITNPTK